MFKRLDKGEAVSKEAASFVLGVTGGAGMFLRVALSRACWQISWVEGMAVRNGVSLVLIVRH
ncbi:MAG: hypothetical protein CVV03_04325 [Firmicutes bacterium HGW-Firmicutes-8]|nr:MAG: hypothetical protein CVV03_04325 [Firmicutes bacterium HGW-Firmicutes-8]